MYDLENMIWATLAKPTDFLSVKETLTRIGVASRVEKTLFQSCHILHKRGRYAIVHFKELFLLDGKSADLTSDDIGRRNTIANLLDEWKLITLEDKTKSLSPIVPINQLKIIAFDEKKDWNLVAKYSIGKKYGAT